MLKAKLFFLLLCFFVLSACDNSGSAVKTQQIAEISIPIEVARVKVGIVSRSFRTTTTLAARAEAEVMAKTSGLVQKILVEEGDQVVTGQLLAVLENERQFHQLARERAELMRLSSELSRITEMHKRMLVSTDVYEKLKWQVNAMEAAVALSELNLRETEIRAPISGVLARRYVKSGQFVNQLTSNSLFLLVNEMQFEAVVHLPEQLAVQAIAGQQAILSFANVSEIAAEIYRVAPVVDATSGTVRITLLVDNSEQKLKAGMFGQVEIKIDTRDSALLVPKQALVTLDSLPAVLVVDAENRIMRRMVNLGYIADNVVEILDGVVLDESVVVAGHATLKEQSLVNVVAEREF